MMAASTRFLMGAQKAQAHDKQPQDRVKWLFSEKYNSDIFPLQFV